VCDEHDGVGAWARRPSSVVYDFPQTSLYFGLTLSRTALSILTGNKQREGFVLDIDRWLI